MPRERVVVVGCGVAGLVSAFALAARGLDVTVLERAAAPGGKMRQVAIGSSRIDSGPTVFTMRWVFDELFAAAGRNFADHVRLRPLDVLARHAWDEQARLDLFSDQERTVDAIGDFAGAEEADGYRAFCRDTRRIYEILEKPFLRASQPSMGGLIGADGLRGLMRLPQIKPFSSMWSALGRYFADPRLRQLFARYATYCGSSPYLAPATLMLVAHVEREGVWSIDGGMHALAKALADCASASGAAIRYGEDVSEVLVSGGRASGVRLASGEQIAADAVIVNADVGAVADGMFGVPARRAAAAIPLRARSLSAMTWSVVAKPDGFALHRHNVFFSDDYAAEFDDIFVHDRLPHGPTVYVCAQDRDDHDVAPGDPERFLILVNAPANGDRHVYDAAEVEQCAQRTFGMLERRGLRIQPQAGAMRVTTPADFNRMFPATGGALYGRSSHGWTASFQRPGARTKVPGLYLAGGSTHPGPGVPMAALSGRSAAASLLADLTSRGSFRRTVMRGGMSTR
ncbi:phytoene desaturase [Bradyrhizobium diazoefficiens]|nr:1-hydroxycarotenoid 3,4-desaturase CrtD [Bradyrhizobium diazoefficiens]UCF53710.1 MAG: phytoene desaturase [Bradyrhizobium sp.]MBR0965068.1 phytoene desaturase [Bradyrhizobium diazoefficiens]MBR0982072.1 phytoene desaturase [Bradyrhizobium diazoefficiens]MBR1008519.1 phytoene desaturase [Bradyrhizobium diazoefficiens]MBR1017971.1 phytoene desaturase [Bradyrhizobium diazoefficiens]